MEKLPFVIMRSNDYCFLGSLRACAAAEIETISILFTWPDAPVWHSEQSSYLKKSYHISNPFTDEQLALSEMINIGKELKKKYNAKLMLIPSSDTNLMFIQNNYNQLKDYFLTMGALNFNEARLDIISKEGCFEALKNIPEHIPLTMKCFERKDIDLIARKMIFPCVFKPATKDYGQSFYKKHKGLKAIKCTNAQELKIGLNKALDDNFKVIVQEEIFFNDAYDEIPLYTYIDKNYDVKMLSTGIKKNIYPSPYGTAIELEFSHHPELFNIASKIAKELKWRGILMIEIIKDLKDQQWKVIEINTRPWLMIDFYRRCGQNYFEYLVKDLNDEELIFKEPNKEILNQKPLHIDMSKLLEQNNNDFSKVMKAINDMNYSCSFTNFINDDQGPAKSEAKLLSSKLNINEDNILRMFKTYGNNL